jgi:hypothetical protein
VEEESWELLEADIVRAEGEKKGRRRTNTRHRRGDINKGIE